MIYFTMRILALDLGERRIGVAVSDPTGTVARPVGVVERKSRAEDLAAIGRLVAEYGVGRVIVGRPLTLRGEAGPQARWVEAYARALAEALPVPVELWDERYTTVAAQEILETTRRPEKRRRRGEVDVVAAAVLLQGVLETRRERENDPVF